MAGIVFQRYLSAEGIASGRRYTLRGTASDNDAVVWQLAGDSVTEYVMEKSAD